MNLEGDHVGSLLNSRRSQNDVELGEGLRVMHLNRLRRGIEGINDVEASHLVSVEVDNHTSCVLHADIQQLIVIHVGELEGLADVRRGVGGGGNGSSLASMPSGIIEIHSVPTLRSLRLKHLPVRVLDLEREERGEHRRHTQRLGRTVLQLLNLQLHLTHIHRHRVTSTRLPSISI